ncbi:hypothetical protein [Pleurocapsa sp. FMAR1]|uniref:hypothetical protein n=1 Tax=Pleurocapsa sp. FMAR1 TaxID=3040204 RepID=UPI0029C67FAB|nr:hypothetical protein [Pleurocapsa sp. FMAR1]
MNFLDKAILATFLINIFSLGGLVARASIKTSQANWVASQRAKDTQVAKSNHDHRDADRAVIEQLEIFAQGLLVNDYTN